MDSVCRVCLTGNIKMQIVHEKHIQDMYEHLTNTKVSVPTSIYVL